MQVKKQLLCSLYHHQAKVTPRCTEAVPVTGLAAVLEILLQGEHILILVLQAVNRDPLLD